MICREIIKEIEARFPKHYAMEWDNVGLQVGRSDKEVKRIYLALDATDEVIEEAADWGADMLITHHPMIFSPIKKIHNLDFVGGRILKLIQNDISYYAMHTNYDVLGMAELSGDKMNMKDAEILEVTAEGDIGKEDEPEGIGRVSDLEIPMTLRECCEDVKDAFHLGAVKVFGNLEDKVKRIAICPGSGKSVIQAALDKHADVLITGDIGHHDAIDAAAQGMVIIDAGHYGLEHIFIPFMAEYVARVSEGCGSDHSSVSACVKMRKSVSQRQNEMRKL